MSRSCLSCLPSWVHGTSSANLANDVASVEFKALFVHCEFKIDACSDGIYSPCSVTVSSQGIFLQWHNRSSVTICWPWVFEIALQNVHQNPRPPTTHLHVARVQLFLPPEASSLVCNPSGGKCVLLVAARSEQERQSFLVHMRLAKKSHYARDSETSKDSCCPALEEADGREIKHEQNSLVSEDRQSQQEVLREFTDQSTLAVAREFTDQFKLNEEDGSPRQATSSSLQAQILRTSASYISRERGDPIVSQAINDERVKVVYGKSPDPLELKEVWICVSQTFKQFQRCNLVCDKLGLSLKPLALAKDVPDFFTSLLKGATELPGTDEDSRELLLMTQLIQFPWSSISAVHEDADFIFANLKPPPEESPRLLRLRPFFRFLGPWNPNADPLIEDADIEDSYPDASQSTNLTPPTPYALALKIRGQLAGTSQQFDDRMHASLQHLSGPVYRPSYVVICCESEADLKRFAGKINEFLMFSLSLVLRNCLTVLPNGKRIASMPNVNRPEQEKEMPLPSPVATFQGTPASLTPRMTLNDDGEVFWQMPRTRRTLSSQLQGAVSRTISRDPEAAYIEQSGAKHDNPITSPRAAGAWPALEAETSRRPPCSQATSAAPTPVTRKAAPACPISL